MTRVIEYHHEEPTVVDQMLENHEDGPKDRFFLTFILFYFLGTASLVPQNFFMTATDYWMYKFRDPKHETYSSENRTALQAEFISDYSIVAHVSNIVFIVLTMAFMKKMRMIKRIISTLCGAIVMFGITCVFVQVDTDSWQVGFFATTLVIAFFLTGFCAIFTATLFEMAAKFPPRYLIPIVSGHSICGLFAAILQIISLSIGASSKTTGLTYFIIGTFFIFLTLVGFLLTVFHSNYFKYTVNKEVKEEAQIKVTKELIFSLINKLKFYLISMLIVLGCTIMIHPALTSLVVSMDKGNGDEWNDVYFVPVITFFSYFAVDYIARELAGAIKKPSNGIIILIISFCRIALVPMLMLCNAHPRNRLPVVFDKDYAYIILILVFAFTNGYLVNLCAIQIPLATKPEERKIAMLLIMTFMLGGLGICSLLSPAMVKAL